MGCGGSKPEDAPEIEPDGDAEPREEAEGLNLRKSAIDSGPLSADDLAKRLMGSEKAETFGLGISDFTLRYAALSQRGYSPRTSSSPTRTVTLSRRSSTTGSTLPSSGSSTGMGRRAISARATCAGGSCPSCSSR